MRRAAIVLALMAAAVVATGSTERLGRALYDAGLPRVAGWLLEGQVWRGATLFAQGRYPEAADAFAGAPFAGAEYDRGTALARAGRLGEAVEALERALTLNPNDEDARYNLALIESLQARREREKRDARNAANADATKEKRGGEAPSSAENEINSVGDGAVGDRDSGHDAESPGRAQVSRMGRAGQTRIDDRGGEARGAVGASEGQGRTGRDGAKVAKSFEQLLKLPKRSFAQQTVHPTPQWLETLADDPGRFLRLKLAAERADRAQRGLAAPPETDTW